MQKTPEELKAETEALRQDCSLIKQQLDFVSRFLSEFGHEMKNFIAPVPGFAQLALYDVMDLGVGFNRANYISFLEYLGKEQELFLPEGLELPETKPKLELYDERGKPIETLDELKFSWFGMLNEYLLTISSASSRSLRLLYDALDLNRIRSGRQEYDFKEIDLGDVVRGKIKTVENIANQKGVSVEQDLAGSLRITADEISVKRAIEAYIDNSLQYTKKGSINIRARQNNEGIEVCVYGTGYYIPKDDEELIFEPFGRLPKADKIISGYGLGMALASLHAKMHNGGVWVKRDAEHGTEFYIRFPFVPSKQDLGSSTLEAKLEGGSPKSPEEEYGALLQRKAFLQRELEFTSGFLGEFGHDMRNFITPIPVCVLSALQDIMQLGVNFGRSIYEQHLGFLRENYGLNMPKDAKMPEKTGDFKLIDLDGSEIRTLDELNSSWFGRLNEYLLTIYDSSQRSEGLLNDALDLNSIKTGTAAYDFRTVDISQLVEKSIASMGFSAREKGLYVESDLESGLTTRADADAMTKVLNNIIGNAVKYTSEGGVQVSLKRDDGVITLAVSDTGPGITKEETTKVFEPFGRLTKTEGIKGHGLGMPITKAHVEAHNGGIWVESEGIPGKGSTFYVTLPFVSKSPVSLVREVSGNWFYLHRSDYLDNESNVRIPNDVAVGATYNTFENLINRFVVGTGDYTIAEQEPNAGRVIRNALINPAVEHLIMSLESIRGRLNAGTLYFIGIDLEAFKRNITDYSRRGVSRGDIDNVLNVSLLSGGRVKRGVHGFFKGIGERDGLENKERYFYELNLETKGEIEKVEDLSPEDFMKYVLDDLIETVRTPRNSLDIGTFERKIAQKGFAFIYANRMAMNERFRDADQPGKPRLYELIEEEFKKIEGN